jgi:NAD+-dependent protein deacetylase sirtuin 5
MQCKPNAAHVALAKFSLPEIRNAIAPDSTFILITQNVDGLSKRALDGVMSPDTLIVPPMPGGKAMTFLRGVEEPIMAEMHGRILDVVCTDKSCRHCETNANSPISEALRGTDALTEAGITEPMIPVADLPRCTNCGALARPGVVWFGEVPHGMDILDYLVRRADLCLVVGTSSTVSIENNRLVYTQAETFREGVSGRRIRGRSTVSRRQSCCV